MTARQQRALSALLQSPTTESAALAAGVGYTTLRRWLREDDAFKKAYQNELTQLVADAATQAKRSMAPALSVLREIIEDQYSSDSSRISAARVLLDYGIRLMEITDVLSRLEALENQLLEEKDARIT